VPNAGMEMPQCPDHRVDNRLPSKCAGVLVVSDVRPREREDGLTRVVIFDIIIIL
jgi:hypothetical protein